MSGHNALYIATLGCHVKVVEILLNSGANVNINSARNKETPLTISAYKGYSVIVALLCQKGANLEALNNEGCTALHAAAEKGHSMLAEILLNGGADIDAQDMDGETPLTKSIGSYQLEMLLMLCERGANLEIRNNVIDRTHLST
eukprot:gene22948-31253_t